MNGCFTRIGRLLVGRRAEADGIIASAPISSARVIALLTLILTAYGLPAGYIVILHRGSVSAPLTITAASKLGLAGMVQFDCTGLPPGVSCVFSPDQAALPSDGTATTSLTIVSSQNTGGAAALTRSTPITVTLN